MRNVQSIPQTNFQLVIPTAVLPGTGTKASANGSLVALEVPGQEDNAPPAIKENIEKEALR